MFKHGHVKGTVCISLTLTSTFFERSCLSMFAVTKLDTPSSRACECGSYAGWGSLGGGGGGTCSTRRTSSLRAWAEEEADRKAS